MDGDYAQLSLRARRELRKTQAQSLTDVPIALSNSTRDFVRQPSSVTLNNLIKDIRTVIDPELEVKPTQRPISVPFYKQISILLQWKDDNIHSEDRVGITVLLTSGNRIIPAGSHTHTDLIIGVVSATSNSLILNNPTEWPDKYVTDKWGRTDNTINPLWHQGETYIPRTERKEWAQVATHGLVLVRKNQLVNKRWLFVRSHGSDICEYYIS